MEIIYKACCRYFQAWHPTRSKKALGTTTAYLEVPNFIADNDENGTPSYTQNAVFRWFLIMILDEVTQGSTRGAIDQSDENRWKTVRNIISLMISVMNKLDFCCTSMAIVSASKLVRSYTE